MSEYRLRNIPPGLWRRVRHKAGDDIQAVLLGLLTAYADHKINPLSEHDPVQAARGAKGGSARVRNQTPEQRKASAAHARAHRRDIKSSPVPPTPDITGAGPLDESFADALKPAKQHRTYSSPCCGVESRIVSATASAVVLNCGQCGKEWRA